MRHSCDLKVYISDADVQKLEALAKARGTDADEIATEVIKTWLDGQATPEEPKKRR